MRWQMILLMFAQVPAAYGQAPGPFRSQIQPILVERCLTCHNPEVRTSGLDLSTREGLMRGGAHGVDLVAGNSAGSRLYEWVAAGKMPPGGGLKPEQVKAIGDWIDQGAAWGPEASIAVTRKRAGTDWWALQTPRKPAVPHVDGAPTAIDAFLLAKLRAKGLDYSPPADRLTLLRRLSFDLTGLPLAADKANEKYGDALERMLQSPQYGERWGRHWLDVVRFGETDGGEHNNERFTAWRYRDYVIAALNQDKPYDQFVREQIAGDVLAPDDINSVAATGFLACGPWDSVTKMINKDELMRRTIRQDELDDMVTTTFATFQGLTVNCARCHDHKFDPIPTRDYYRLTAVFQGAGFGDRQIASPDQRDQREALLAPLRRQMSAARKELSTIEDAVKTRLLLAKLEQVDAGRAPGARRMQLNAVFNHNVFPPVTARYARMVVTSQFGKAVPRVDRLELLPAGHVVTGWKAAKEASDNEPVYLEMDLGQERGINGVKWSSDAATGVKDGAIRVYRLEVSTDRAQWRQAASSLDHDVPAEYALPEVSEAELVAALPASSIEPRRQLQARLRQVQADIDAVPALASVHAVKPEPLTASHLLLRGSLSSPGEEVTPGALSTVKQLGELAIGNPSEEGARRLALAHWLTDPGNPLTARVIVNRVWYFHFGNGIVNTPSDFGFNGDRPSHPELLDWLANEFVEHGWSLKWLHRQIVATRAYQQSSASSEKAHAVDADNRLLWRMPVKRMDAETMRDSILFVAGNLNPERSGPSYLLQKKETKGSYMHKRLDNDGPEVWRRAVYRFVVRGGERIFLDS
ncbi:MAG: DUF1549 domain-containing protein, partial [Acidobacteriia bacterium]|nr:DUF1549 domain-containing protein [Terriglobia bacterium]